MELLFVTESTGAPSRDCKQNRNAAEPCPEGFSAARVMTDGQGVCGRLVPRVFH